MAVLRGKKIALSLCVTKIGDDRISPPKTPKPPPPFFVLPLC